MQTKKRRRPDLSRQVAALHRFGERRSRRYDEEADDESEKRELLDAIGEAGGDLAAFRNCDLAVLREFVRVLGGKMADQQEDEDFDEGQQGPHGPLHDPAAGTLGGPQDGNDRGVYAPQDGGNGGRVGGYASQGNSPNAPIGSGRTKDNGGQPARIGESGPRGELSAYAEAEFYEANRQAFELCGLSRQAYLEGLKLQAAENVQAVQKFAETSSARGVAKTNRLLWNNAGERPWWR